MGLHNLVLNEDGLIEVYLRGEDAHPYLQDQQGHG